MALDPCSWYLSYSPRLVEDQTPLGTEARWAGSVASGYVVGVLAGLANIGKNY